MFIKMLCILLSISCSMNFKEISKNDLFYYLTTFDNIYILYDNLQYDYTHQSMNLIKNEFDKLLENSYEMPSLGISIHIETIQKIKKGLWIKLTYNKTIKHLDMDFNELLIKITPNDYGLNIIRGNNGIFEGRCYYISLNTNNFNFYNNLVRIIKTSSTN